MSENFVISEADDGSISTSINGHPVYFTHSKRRSKFFAWRAGFAAYNMEGYGETVDDALIDLWQTLRTRHGV